MHQDCVGDGNGPAVLKSQLDITARVDVMILYCLAPDSV